MAYSGDALAGPLKVLKKTMAEVAVGKLCVPGYVPSGEAGRGHVHVEAVVDDAVGSEHSSSDSDLTSGEDTKLLVQEFGGLSAGSPSPAREDGLDLYRHCKYGTFHYRQRGETSLQPRVLCGRVLSDRFALIGDWPVDPQPFCMICANSRRGVA
eukprot:6490742-Amphidinium_carterae.1